MTGGRGRHHPGRVEVGSGRRGGAEERLHGAGAEPVALGPGDVGDRCERHGPDEPGGRGHGGGPQREVPAGGVPHDDDAAVVAAAQLDRQDPQRDPHVLERGVRVPRRTPVLRRDGGEPRGREPVDHRAQVLAVVRRSPEAAVDHHDERPVVATELDLGDVERARPPRHHDVRLRAGTGQHRLVLHHPAIVAHVTGGVVVSGLG